MITEDEMALRIVDAMKAICKQAKTRQAARVALRANIPELDLSGPLSALPEYLRLPE